MREFEKGQKKEKKKEKDWDVGTDSMRVVGTGTKDFVTGACMLSLFVSDGKRDAAFAMNDVR